jgi:5,10-methenyltetrahydromethanopterin hydrogenase
MADPGVYTMVDQVILEEAGKFDGDEFVERLYELLRINEVYKHEIYSIDKLWDGLHFLLTGVSASSPIEGNKLSEAIVGTNVVKADDDFTSYTGKDELPEIIKALENVNIKELERTFDPEILKKKKIYSNI